MNAATMRPPLEKHLVETLPVQLPVFNRLWTLSRLMARLKKPMPSIDGLIAATALRHRFAIVTRNESDFAATGADLLNPWKD